MMSPCFGESGFSVVNNEKAAWNGAINVAGE
jgi:hypothetical protein